MKTKRSRIKPLGGCPRRLKKLVFFSLILILSLGIVLNPVFTKPVQAQTIEALVIGYYAGVGYGIYSLIKFIINKVRNSWTTDLSISFNCPEGLEVISDMGSGMVPMEIKNLYSGGSYSLDFYTREDEKFSGIIVIQKPPSRPELSFDVCLSPAIFQSSRLNGSARIQAQNEMSQNIFTLTIYPENHEN